MNNSIPSGWCFPHFGGGSFTGVVIVEVCVMIVICSVTGDLIVEVVHPNAPGEPSTSGPRRNLETVRTARSAQLSFLS